MSPEFRKWLMAEKAKLEKAYRVAEPTDEFSVPVADVVAHLEAAFRYVPVMRCEICDCEIRQHPVDTSPRRCQICAEWSPR